MTSATDELRRLLTEAGVEWDADDEVMDDGSLSQVTYWYCNGIEWSADGRDEYLAFDAVQLLTPAQAVEATLGHSSNCSNSERTTTVDETETWECVCDGIGRYGKRVTVHVMECSACGRTYEHVNGDYEYCPHCRARIVEVSA